MGEISCSVLIEAERSTCYAWWRGLTKLDEILPEVSSVTPVNGDPRLTRWEVRGPFGVHVAWEAQILEDLPNQRIAWRSMPSEQGTYVENSGSVEFWERERGCEVAVHLSYNPPAGGLGEAVARMLADPQAKVERALRALKAEIEGASAGYGAVYPQERRSGVYSGAELRGW